ncbi:MAG: rod shape-determining protein MreC [Prevotella sp.]|jgi:rod shape-determining protein MreC|nr:rod shape-determining protein MreC [Prevotella sp.]
MENLWKFLSRHFHWLLFIILEAVSVVMLFSYNSYQSSVWISSANLVAGKIYECQAEIEQFFSLNQQNEQLSQHNLILEKQLDMLRTRYERLSGDTIVFQQEMENLDDYQLIPAKVVSNSVNQRDNLITINKGSSDGIETDMGVLCGNGIVGVVYLTSLHYAIVIPALNNRSRISCSIRGTDYFGYLTWSGGDPTRANVEDIPRHAKFKKGDWIETSGYSSIFPHGISVGRIEKIFNSHDGLSYRLQVRLSTDFSCLRDVYVINDKSMAERMRLKEAAIDSLMLTPIKE